MFCQMYLPTPICPLMPPGRGIWWPRVVLTWVPLTWAHVLLSATDCLEFSWVLSNRLSPFSCVTPNAPTPLPVPLTPSSQVQASSGHSGNTTCHQPVGQADVLSDVPPPPYATRWSGTNLGPIDLSSCSFVCNRPSWVFMSTFQYCLHFSFVTPIHPTPLLAPDAPPPPTLPVQASSGQDLYYCRSAWHVISLWVRLMFCQMYLPTPSPLNAPR